MLLKTLREKFYMSLKDYYPETEIQSFFNLLTESFLKMKRLDVALYPFTPVSAKKAEKFEDALIRLKNHEPIQYILGRTEFYELYFKVTEDTLIPRPETEELVHWIIDTIGCSKKNITILDIGTGSGCIAVALAKNLPNAVIYGLDISKKALTVARGNAKLNLTNVQFVEMDVLNWNNSINQEIEHLRFDVIVSNPPYVRNLEKSQMDANVLKHEPSLALYVDDGNPLIFYKAITEFASEYLKNDGQLFFEINQYLGPQMYALLKSYNFTCIELKKDIFNNDRMLRGIK